MNWISNLWRDTWRHLSREYEDNRRRFLGFLLTFACGAVLGIVFKNAMQGVLWVNQSADWLLLIVIKPSFFGTFFRLFLFYGAFFFAFFVLCSFHWLYPLSYLLVMVRGSIFVLTTIFIIEMFAFLAIVYFLFMLVLQQILFIALAGYTCSFCRNGRCRSARCFDYVRGRLWQFLLVGLVASIAIALFLCLVLYLIINPLLSFV